MGRDLRKEVGGLRGRVRIRDVPLRSGAPSRSERSGRVCLPGDEGQDRAATNPESIPRPHNPILPVANPPSEIIEPFPASFSEAKNPG
jgi:hypothetical protein